MRYAVRAENRGPLLEEDLPPHYGALARRADDGPGVSVGAFPRLGKLQRGAFAGQDAPGQDYRKGSG